MGTVSNYYRTVGTGLAIFFSTCLLTSTAEAVVPSSLSKWLSKQAVPELRERLEQHPLYQDQRIAIVAARDDALSEALVTLLHMNLGNRAGIALWQPHTTTPVAGASASTIDALECNSQTGVDYTLQVSASPRSSGRSEVSILLLPVNQPAPGDNSWHWKGKLNRAEQEYIERAAASVPANGSLAAPWRDEEVEIAARSLSDEFACALRPQVRTHVALQWPEQTGLPALFADTINTSRHLLGSYRELAQVSVNADYEVSVELRRFREDTWQLWLIGTPLRAPLLPVQAVTYFQVTEPDWPIPSTATNTIGQAYSLPLGEAVDFIDVEMLDATQRDSGRASAELEVTLRIANRADWALQYSFTLSGGHFNHCIADPAYYRHDGYGQVEGRIDAGDSVVRRLVISGTKHRPTPAFGTRKCAGFRDLDGFEEFADRGYKVTDFVRWDTSGGMRK
jgi:hypothetical protein